MVGEPAERSEAEEGHATAWGALEAAEAARRLGVDPDRGLGDGEAKERLEAEGPNRVRRADREPAWRLLLRQFRSPLILLLLGAAAVAGAVGQPGDALVIAAVLTLNAIIGFVQEYRARKSMAALQEMLTFTARVLRDGERREVDGAELVPGDVVLLRAGDRVPADGRLVAAEKLTVNESTLTGESTAVDKDVAPVDEDVPLAERSSELFMGTSVTRGEATLVVTRTGDASEMGRISSRLREGESRRSPLERRLDGLAARLTTLALLAAAAVVVVAMLRGESFGEALVGGVVLAVAAIPEGLPAIVTVTLALGMRAMAKRGAIVEDLRSIHTLGATTALCTDKTGTLTLNEMTVRVLEGHGTRFEVGGEGYEDDGEIAAAGDGGGGEPPRAALEVAALCNDAELVDGEVSGDPTEGALLVLARKAGLDPGALSDDLPRVAEVPFSSERKFMATFHEDGDRVVLLAKGAPGVMLERCSSVAGAEGETALDDAGREELEEAVESLTSDGLRVLALARADGRDRPEGEPDEEKLAAGVTDLRLEGLAAMEDPPRPGASAAVGECREAGIAVRMVTGDHAGTARAIAAKLGIEGDVVGGGEVEEMSDEELARRIGAIGVLARVDPEHKIRVIEALAENGEVVAMTGDGVNDAVALERADVGIAMGRRGTEVAKEAGDVVLTDDRFATIVEAVRRGRAIFDDILTFVQFNLTTGVAALLTILVSESAGLGTPFTPVQVLWINLIMDGPPAMALGVDPPGPDVMRRPPRDPEGAILTRPRLLVVLALAAWMAAGTLGLLWYVADGAVDGRAGTLAFTAFVLFQLVNAVNVRSGARSVLCRRTFTNRFLWGALALVLALQVAVVQVPVLGELFGTTPLALGEWLWAAGIALSLLAASEAARLVLRHAGTAGASRC